MTLDRFVTKFDADKVRPVAIYRRTDRTLVAVFPNWHACKSVISNWGDLSWWYADEPLV